MSLSSKKEAPLGSRRLGMRAIKGGMLLASCGFLIEGLFELRKLKRAFTQPPSVPGDAKIIEHFAVQHLAFPVLGGSLIFWPSRLERLFSSQLVRFFLGGIALALMIPETVVSLRHNGDLFRPYPFDLRNRRLKALERVPVGQTQINLVQAEHLVLNHWLFPAVLMALCLRPAWLHAFAGPRTGGTK